MLAVGLIVPPAYSQALASWRDPSSHAVRFVTAEKGVQLEVLDWGGSGNPVVLLAGGGNTAHVFDDFAPKLAFDHHVYGITRRGFGASGFSPSDHPLDRLRDDVLDVIAALKLERPVLVGHSIAGAEMSAVAISHPDRIAGVVYLEAAYPYAFESTGGPSMKEF
jgi:pimeloyl-ACP methyl ester carboxylesterase